MESNIYYFERQGTKILYFINEYKFIAFENSNFDTNNNIKPKNKNVSIDMYSNNFN